MRTRDCFTVGPDERLWNIYLFAVDYAIYCDAGADPQCRGGLCGGRLLWTECCSLSASSMVRIGTFNNNSPLKNHAMYFILLKNKKNKNKKNLR